MRLYFIFLKLVLIFQILHLNVQVVKCTAKNGLLVQLNEMKEWKKLIKSKTNVLINFSYGGMKGNSGGEMTESDLIKLLRETADKIKGVGTIAIVYCSSSSSEVKKLCKRVKVSSTVLKHYHNGEFNRDYDRALKLSSLINFMKDPTGDLPWDEDSTATSILHLPDSQSLMKAIKKEVRGLLVLFYAPWCGFCKKMKPDYGAAAQELSESLGVLAAIDVSKTENSGLRQKFNISGFPTLLYFKNGALKQQYEGENTKDGILSFMKDPNAPAAQKPKEENWADEPSEVAHLTSDTFDEFIKSNPSVLVMFYAPWCGHCKRLKPIFIQSAQKLKDLKINGRLAAVDATQESSLGKRFDVSGYPTLKYFENGELKFDAGHARDEESLIKFMESPSEPPPPPPPELPWEEEPSHVVHLNEDNFRSTLKRKKHALVMFYAPWCGHCKAAKPEMVQAAEELKDDPKVLFGAVDCTIHKTLCSTYDVKGFPTFKHFTYFDKEEVRSYDGPRTKQDLSNEVAPESSKKSFYADWDGISGQENVKKLTDDSIAPFLKSHESVLVMFYAPWCGHCRTMKPDYARAATSLARDSSSATLAALDCVQNPHAAERYRIQGYPTLKYYRYGSLIGDFERGRRTTDFINFMLRPPMTRDEL